MKLFSQMVVEARKYHDGDDAFKAAMYLHSSLIIAAKHDRPPIY